MEAIEDFRAEHGYAPSIREIGARVGLASATVHQWIVKLRKDGRLGGAAHLARAYVSADPVVLTVDRLELAWCESVHGRKPPHVRPCKRHRTMAEWLVKIVIPKAMRVA